MKTYLAFTALGEVSTQQMEQLCAAIKECKCNIEVCRFLAINDLTGMLMLLGGGWGAIAKFEDMLPRLGEKNGLLVRSRRAQEMPANREMMPYAIDLVAVDRDGIVNDVVTFTRHHEIQIREMQTNCYDAASGEGARMFNLHAVVNIPTNTAISSLRAHFTDLCDHLNLDAIIEPVKQS